MILITLLWIIPALATDNYCHLPVVPNSVTSVICRWENLESIPKLHPGIVTLDLRWNSISSLAKGTFANLPSLKNREPYYNTDDGSSPFDGCSLSTAPFPVLAIYIIVSVFILFLVGIIVYRIGKILKKKRADQEKFLAMAPWEVPLNAVLLETKLGHGAFGVVWRGKLTTIPKWMKESSVATARKAPPKTVQIAVKTINEEADCCEKQEFLREIDMMKNVGHHRNIVNMIACCVKVDPPLLIMEFVAYGDLLKFLRKSRDQITGKAESSSKYYAGARMEDHKNSGASTSKFQTFVKPDETTVLIEKETDTEHSNCIKVEISTEEMSANNAKEDDIKEKDVEDVLLFNMGLTKEPMFGKEKDEEAKLQKTEKDLSNNSKIEKNANVVTAQKYIVQEDDKDNERENYFQKPLGENGQEEFENNKEMEGEDNAEKADEEVDDDDDDEEEKEEEKEEEEKDEEEEKEEEEEEDEDKELFPEDLLGFAWQITKGMEYLSNKGYIHRDLAARNVLIGHGKVAKVADFGLSREMSNEERAYRVKTGRKLPLKWMSPESIFDMVFTTKSDVWSFGIVLWEIITIGGAPYPSIGNQHLIELLKRSYRMKKPEFCPDVIYEMMTKCWNQLPENRPSFTELRTELEALMSENKQYLDLVNIEGTPEYMNLGSDSEDETADQTVIDNVRTPFIKKSSHKRAETSV